MNSRICILLTVCAVIFSSCKNKNNQQAPQQAAPRSYPTETMKTGNTTIYTTYPVTIKGQEDIEIRPRIDGFIKEVYIDEGSAVRKGQNLFKIDSPVSEQNVRTSEANLESARAKLNTERVNADRIRP